MKRELLIATAIALAANTAMAANTPPSPTSDIAGVPTIVAPYAQAEAYIRAGGVVAAAKGIASVSNPATGVYCIQLAAGIHKSRLPYVTVEWGGSSGNDLFAFVQQASPGFGCTGATVNTIEVRTYAGNPAVASNAVAFNITVP